MSVPWARVRGMGSVRGAEGWMMGMKGDGMRERGM
jgi:hypothetical protein